MTNLTQVLDHAAVFIFVQFNSICSNLAALNEDLRHRDQDLQQKVCVTTLDVWVYGQSLMPKQFTLQGAWYIDVIKSVSEPAYDEEPALLFYTQAINWQRRGNPTLSQITDQANESLVLRELEHKTLFYSAGLGFAVESLSKFQFHKVD